MTSSSSSQAPPKLRPVIKNLKTSPSSSQPSPTTKNTLSFYSHSSQQRRSLSSAIASASSVHVKQSSFSQNLENLMNNNNNKQTKFRNDASPIRVKLVNIDLVPKHSTIVQNNSNSNVARANNAKTIVTTNGHHRSSNSRPQSDVTSPSNSSSSNSSSNSPIKLTIKRNLNSNQLTTHLHHQPYGKIDLFIFCLCFCC